jgi:deoxycytidylate deaminase
MADNGTVSIHGKEYKTVALRVKEFRDMHPCHSITAKVLSAAELVQVKATIRDESGRVIATGLAEEMRGSTNINKTSALENAETSAIGRALAFFGLGGTEIASADEVANAIHQQKELEAVGDLLAHNALVREHTASIVEIQQGLARGDYSSAKEAWQELTEDEQRGLWRATTKGGIFTTKEREQMKSAEWGAA